MKNKLAQINEIAALYDCEVWFDHIRRAFVQHDGKATEVESWYIAREWPRDKWIATFERISGFDSAELR